MIHDWMVTAAICLTGLWICYTAGWIRGMEWQKDKIKFNRSGYDRGETIMEMERTVDREILRYAVARQITCQISGRVLDVKNTVAAEVKFRSGNVNTIVVDASQWEHVAPGLRSLRTDERVESVTIYDGRALFGSREVKIAS